MSTTPVQLKIKKILGGGATEGFPTEFLQLVYKMFHFGCRAKMEAVYV